MSFEAVRAASFKACGLPAHRASEPQYELGSGAGGQPTGLLSLSMSFEAVRAASPRGF